MQPQTENSGPGSEQQRWWCCVNHHHNAAQLSLHLHANGTTPEGKLKVHYLGGAFAPPKKWKNNEFG
jgi:hypothetical protein